MRKLLILTVLVCVFSSVSADNTEGMKALSADSAWWSKGLFSLNMGQTSFTNWAPGGDNNVSFNTIFIYDLNYKKDIVSWNNHFDLEYGTMVFINKKPKKTNDKIYLTSKLGYSASKNWNYSFYWSLNTQFSNGYKYPNDSVPISRFMAPGYLMMGVGMDFKPGKNLSVLLSPFTYKLTIVNDAELADKGTFGIEPAIRDSAGNIIVPAKRFKNEPGGFVKVFFQHSFTDGFKFSTRLELFSSYYENPFNIDVRWNILSIYRITKSLAVTFTLDVVYDNDAVIKEDIDGDGIDEVTGPRTQVKESLGLGLSLKW